MSFIWLCVYRLERPSIQYISSRVFWALARDLEALSQFASTEGNTFKTEHVGKSSQIHSKPTNPVAQNSVTFQCLLYKTKNLDA